MSRKETLTSFDAQGCTTGLQWLGVTHHARSEMDERLDGRKDRWKHFWKRGWEEGLFQGLYLECVALIEGH